MGIVEDSYSSISGSLSGCLEYLSGFAPIQQKDEMHCWATALVWFGRVMRMGPGHTTQEAMFRHYQTLGYTIKEGDFVDPATGGSRFVGAITGHNLIRVLESPSWKLKVKHMTGSALSDARMEHATGKGPAIIGFNVVNNDEITGNHVNVIWRKDMSAFNPSFGVMEPATGSFETRYLGDLKANPYVILGYVD